jgi:hypothetical protein
MVKILILIILNLIGKACAIVDLSKIIPYVFFVFKLVQYSGAILNKIKLFFTERFKVIPKDKLTDNADTAA